MSIPKEPRQLMVNLMYLVLTCMLALNVSAEVLQAFFSIDKSLGESNRLVEGSNQQLVQAIGDQAAAYAQFQPYKEKAAQVQVISSEFFDFVGKMKDNVVLEAGGLGPDEQPLRKADKDIPTRLFVSEGGGEKLQKKVEETREKLLALVDEPAARKDLSERIPLKINEIPASSDKKTWAQFTFQQMPVAAVLPVLTKFQNDAKVAETAILNHFAGKMNITVKPDKFAPVIAADKSYVIRGRGVQGGNLPGRLQLHRRQHRSERGWPVAPRAGWQGRVRGQSQLRRHEAARNDYPPHQPPHRRGRDLPQTVQLRGRRPQRDRLRRQDERAVRGRRKPDFSSRRRCAQRPGEGQCQRCEPHPTGQRQVHRRAPKNRDGHCHRLRRRPETDHF
ncbi:MAG: hypothetical protein IPM82_32565 [Saprospiraceae bacterium]|nr:hypothetical protein [Saprospiraceae bacterium]